MLKRRSYTRPMVSRDGHTVYLVTVWDDGSTSCTCRNAQFRGQVCAHQREALAERRTRDADLDARCATVTIDDLTWPSDWA